MVTHLHASCWNEERMLPFFFEHYDRFVDRYFIHDNDSDDGSLEILAAHPRVTVLPLVLEGDSMCQAAFEKVNELWKPSVGQADWVAVCNIDELFWHPDLPWYLKICKNRGITHIPAIGWNMVSDRFPEPGEHLPRTLRTGMRADAMDKPSFFNPNAITDSGFAMARHSSQPRGRVVVPDRPEVQLLHYKHLGEEYTLARQAELWARMRSLDRERKWGFHYEPELVKKRLAELRANASTVAAPARGEGQSRRAKWKPRAPKAVRVLN